MSVRAVSTDVLAVRSAVRESLADLAAGTTVIVACSGGPDSIALAAATAWVAPRLSLRARAVVVDHGLQADSAAVAEGAARACRGLGLPASVASVVVGTEGGPEAAARLARYGALAAAAEEDGAAVVLLGHTREDQAETVLLRLARGSGARSLAAMSRVSGLWRRPFLDLPRATVRAAAEEAVGPGGTWSDPHNEDREYARVRVRALLAGLVDDLGPGVVLGLARSADLLRDDADALDTMADAVHVDLVRSETAGWSAPCTDLAALPAAILTRVLRRMALDCGAPADDLGVDHVRAVAALVVDWHGQGPTSLPGGVRAERDCGRLWILPGAGTEVVGGV